MTTPLEGLVSPSLSSRISERRGSPISNLLAAKRRLLDEGRELIDLSLADPAFPPPAPAVVEIAEAFADPSMSRYGYQEGFDPFRQAVARYMARRYGVEVDPHREILPVIGAMDGLGHLGLVVADAGDLVISPDPSFLVYEGARLAASADVHTVTLAPESDYLLELDSLPQDVLERARLVYLNYPHNPTGAAASLEYLQRTVETCRRFGIAIGYDAAYIEIAFDGYRSPSLLEVPGAREVAIEFHSMSKTYAMAGWRIGWAVGSAHLIDGLQKMKAFIDTGPLLAVQRAAVPVLDRAEELMSGVVEEIGRRRQAAIEALEEAGLPYWKSPASPFLWLRLPTGVSCEEIALRLLSESGVSCWAGTAFGPGGDGHLRLAVAEPPDRMIEAVHRIASILKVAETSLRRRTPADT